MPQRENMFCIGKRKYSDAELADIIWKASREGKPRPTYFKCTKCLKFHLV